MQDNNLQNPLSNQAPINPVPSMPEQIPQPTMPLMPTPTTPPMPATTPAPMPTLPTVESVLEEPKKKTPLVMVSVVLLILAIFGALGYYLVSSYGAKSAKLAVPEPTPEEMVNEIVPVQTPSEVIPSPVPGDNPDVIPTLPENTP